MSEAAQGIRMLILTGLSGAGKSTVLRALEDVGYYCVDNLPIIIVEKLLELSTRDPLTGLYNRRYLTETLAREIARALRKGQPLGLLLADVDHFKAINDTFGHLAGDDVLCRIAQVLNACVRKSDVACRLGGDEFVLMFPECAREAVIQRMERLAGELARLTFEFEGRALGSVTVCFGVACLPEDGDTPADLLKAADAALYAEKTLRHARSAAH